MSTDWNPSLPGLLGPEWLPIVEKDAAIASDAVCFAQKLTSTAAETIETIRLPINQIITPGRYLLEVYEAGDEVPGAVTTATHRPNEDTANTNFEDEGGATTSLYASVDESTLDLSDYIVNSNATIFGNLWTYKLDTAAWAASRRITQMRVVSVGQQISGQHEWEWAIRKQGEGFLRIARNTYTPASGLFTATAYLGEINPFTGLPWTQAEIATFDSTATAGRLSLRFGLATPSATDAEARLYQTYLEIDYVTENRVALGAADISGAAGTVDFTMYQPDGTATYSKANATDYTYVLRRIPSVGNPTDPQAGQQGASVGSITWGYLDAVANGLPSAMVAESYAPSLGATGVITSLGDALTRGFGLSLDQSGGTPSVDGIYDDIEEAYPQATPPRQKLTTGAATTYDGLACVLRMVDESNPPGDLTVRVKRFSDDVQFGSDMTLTAAEFLELERSVDGWAVAFLYFDVGNEASLAATTQYYVEWEAAETAGEGWAVAFGSLPIGYGSSSFDGTSDNFRTGGVGGYVDHYDAFVMLVDLAASTLTGVAITTMAVTGDNTDCEVLEIDGVRATWTQSAHASFDHYELQRSIDGGTTWETIAEVYDVTQLTFDDWEGPRGVAASYRQRVWAYDPAIPGLWSSTADATPAAADCELLFMSNEDPTLNLAHFDEGGTRTYGFQDADRVTFYPVADRDGQIALQPTERLGDRWSVQLVLNATAAPASPGRVVFDGLLDLALADLPHVTVLDSDGNRWIAKLQVPTGSRTEAGALYVAEVTITTVAFEPTPVVVPA